MKKLGMVVLTFAVLLLTGCGTDYAKLEKDFTSSASKFYEDNMQGKVVLTPGSTHQVTLKLMEDGGVDISAFTKEGCDKTSSVLIKPIVKDGKETDQYNTETTLICGDYKTKNK